MRVPKPPIKKTFKERPLKAWHEVLEQCGFPRPVVVIDFETFFDSEFTLKKMSTIEHIMDDRFEVLGVSIKFEGHEAIFHRGEKETQDAINILKIHYGENLERCTVVAHNAKYDTSILAWRYGIKPKYIVDLYGLAQHWDARARNNLDDITKRIGLPPKGDTQEFKEWTTRVRYKKRGGRGKQRLMPVRLPIITPEMWEKLASYANNDAEREFELLEWYLPRLSRPDVELESMNHTLHLYIDPVIEVDEEAAFKLIDEMEAEIDKVMANVGHTRKEISGENSFQEIMDDALTAAGDNIGKYLKKKKTPEGKPQLYKLAIAKDDPQREKLERHDNKFVRELMEAKNALSSWPNHIKRIHNIVNQCRAAGGKLPVPLNYCGAHTGRWSGGEKINLQNLGSRGHELVNRIRTLLIAPDGYEFVIADAASIESRMNAWVAGQQDKLDKFEAGEEMYCRLAELVLSKPVGSLRKPVPEHKWEEKGCIPEVEKMMKRYRNVYGKTGDLACGYGGGEAAVFRFAPDLDLDMRLRIRDIFREVHPEIVKFWHEVEAKFIYTAKYGKSCTMKNGLRFHQTKDVDVIITLPCGRELKYHKVRIGEGNYGKEAARIYNPKEHKWEYTWGGTLTENIVQAISRDVLWEAIRRLLRKGIRIVHHVHDELIALVKKGQGNNVLKMAIDSLRQRPQWALDCPLDGEGVVTTRYGGH